MIRLGWHGIRRSRDLRSGFGDWDLRRRDFAAAAAVVGRMLLCIGLRWVGRWVAMDGLWSR